MSGRRAAHRLINKESVCLNMRGNEKSICLNMQRNEESGAFP
jgi:hypothetical protein